MDTKTFESALRSDGYADVETKGVPAGTHNDEHSHPFDVRALVIEGRIALTVDGVTRTYDPGQVFTMPAGCRHAEDVGEQGVRYVVGRRRPAT